MATHAADNHNILGADDLLSGSEFVPRLKIIYYAIIFFLVIATSQYLTHVKRIVSFEQHVQIQQNLSEIIANFVHENLPQMTNFKMHSVYTKSLKNGSVVAYFNYSFVTPAQGEGQSVETELKGTASLQKIKDSPNQEWALNNISIDGETVTFQEPLLVTPNNDLPADLDNSEESHSSGGSGN